MSATLGTCSTAGGLEVRFGKAGSGPDVLFLPGTDGDLARHDEVDPFLAALTARFTVWAYDQRGLGSTSKPPGPYTMTDYANDARDVLDALDLGALPVIGYSFGGMVAQEFALAHASRVSRLALVCTSSGGNGGSSYPVHELSGLPPAERHSRRLALWDTRRDPAWQRAHPIEVARWTKEWDAFEALTAATPGQPAGGQGQLAAREQHDTYDRLSSLTVPVLVLGGVWDGVAPIDRQTALARQIPWATIGLFDGGHRVLWEDPGAAHGLAEFLGG